MIALEYGIHSETAKRIYDAAELHDIGKSVLPKSIIEKPGKLTKDEFAIIKTHTLIGAELLKGLHGELGIMARESARYHHEWQSGEGYWRIYADELPQYIPIISIADVFVSLINERPYKHAWPWGEAVEYIKAQAGKQFNPMLVKTFLSIAREENRASLILPH
jgi:putative two-component system response regulator